MSLNKTTGFEKIANRAYVDTSCSIRDIYDESIRYAYGNNPPLYLHEKQIQALMVNTIRHKHTNYMKDVYNIDRLSHKYKPRYYIYKNVVLNKIAEEYPFLEQECNRQKHKITMVRRV